MVIQNSKVHAVLFEYYYHFINRVTKRLCLWRCVLIVRIFLCIHTLTCLLILASLFIVDADEIKRLGKRFRKLDLDNSGSLSIDEFMSLPELQQNPLVQRVIDIFDTDRNGEVDFKGTHLCQHLSIVLTFLTCAPFRIHSRSVAIQRQRRQRI